jgi:hypothetical protein
MSITAPKKPGGARWPKIEDLVSGDIGVRRRPKPVNKIFLVASKATGGPGHHSFKKGPARSLFSFGGDDPGGYRKINL